MDSTWAASLGNDGAVEPKVIGSASLVNRANELEVKGGIHACIRVVAEPYVIDRASACSGDGDIALDEPRPPDCDSEIGNVQVGNAGTSERSDLQKIASGTAMA
ncbi:hypothetical protein GUJ93_ZPchr0011g28424 [Zizania palustris]|uniref:Uncharacterized protein n=1 Tax=Zizania palustris TaxID=103762 RepID=A0A8J6BSK4_ZIZPA|nr:hypothetical protein GUJ93_ZPchr0011g28424 [Zizania palustris]